MNHSSLTPKTRNLFAKRWVKTEDRLWRTCLLCKKNIQFVQQHLRHVHQKSDIGAYSVTLKDQWSRSEGSNKRVTSATVEFVAKKSRKVRM